MSIPRTLHRIEIGQCDPDRRSRAWWDGFASLHPGWELRTWTEPVDPDDYELGRLFSTCGSAGQLSDLLRIELLWRHGGVYVDCDVEPIASIEPLIGLDFFIGTENGLAISNAIVGARAGHPVLRALLDRLLQYEAVPAGVARDLATGPSLCSSVLDEQTDFLVAPREVFYPYTFSPEFARRVGVAPLAGEPAGGSGPWSRRHSLCVRHSSATASAPSSSEGPWSVHRALVRLRGRADNLARQRILPRLRQVASKVIEVPTGTHGVFVGNNRILVSTTDHFPMYVIADDLSLTPELVSRGWYDPALLGFMDGVLRPGDWFIDVGANVGLFTVAATRRVGRWGKVVAFEADPEVAAVCHQNVEMNWRKNVEVVSAAAGSAAGVTRFARHPTYRGSSAAGLDDLGSRAVPDTFEWVEVPVERIDARVPLAIPVRLVKIDVEGGESDVLDGMQRLFEQRKVDFLVLEVIRSHAGKSWGRLLGHLETFVRRDHARLFTPTSGGRRVPITLEEVIAGGMLSQLIVDFVGADQ